MHQKVKKKKKFGYESRWSRWVKENLKLRKNWIEKKWKKMNAIKCVCLIVEVNVPAEAISAKVRFPGHSTKIFALSQKKTIAI